MIIFNDTVDGNYNLEIHDTVQFIIHEYLIIVYHPKLDLQSLFGLLCTAVLIG